MNYGGHFDPDSKKKRIDELEAMMQDAHFWDNKKQSEQIINEANTLKNQLSEVTELKKKIEANIELLELLKVEDDEEMKSLIESEITTVSSTLEQLEILILLNGPYDKNDAILEIHSGAGGTEACDWANMLYRMYARYIERHHDKMEVIDEQPGDEAGMKSVTLIVHGMYSYGYLKNEQGVHRLIRISPFDSGARRHTSFASVDIMPLFDNDKINIEIKPEDIRIDIYRSGGHGGQGVNTTDSAVRITHLPTKTVVTCQNERSQIQNKERAMEVLKNKLYQLELEKKEQMQKDMRGEQREINFGSQIRSYIMHPYSMVKDHRTGVETSNVNKVLDGELDLFMNASLKSGGKDGVI